MINKDKIMKNKRLHMISSIILVCLLIFASCDNFSAPIKNGDEDGYGRIAVNIAGEKALQKDARTILPPTIFDKYVFIFTKAGEETGVETKPDNDGYFLLEIGNYTVTVMAYNDDILVAKGVSSQFSVSSGNNTPVAVLLTSVNSTAKGYFNYTITYPANSVAEITLLKWSLQEEIALNPIDLTGGGYGINETLELQYGSYILTVLIIKDGLYAGISEAIHINSSNTTIYTKQFNSDDLLEARTPLTSDYNFTGIGEFVYDGSVKTVNITPKAIASQGIITILYNGSTELPISAGTYTVTFNVAASSIWNAVNGLPSGTLTISPKTITITGVSATNRNYDGTTTIILNGGTLVGVLAGDSVDFVLGNGTMSDSSAGNNKAVSTTIQLIGSNANNYTLIQPNDITVNITAMESFTLTFAQIIDATPAILNQTISRTGSNKTVTLIINNPSQYSSISWYVTGTNVSGNGTSFTLDATNPVYSRIGEYFLTVEVWKDGKPYNKTIIFTVTR